MTKFLSATKLGISTAEHRALVRTAELIGASAFIPDDEIEVDDNQEATSGLGFNMGYQAQPANCGTVCCIGGHVSLLMQGVDLTAEYPCITFEERERAQEYVNRSEPGQHGCQPLSPLYWPGHTPNGQSSQEVMDRARPADAIHAIRNFLTTGRPDWEEVIQARLADEALSHA